MSMRSLYSLAQNATVSNNTNRSLENENEEEQDEEYGFSPEVDIIPILFAVLIILVNGWVLCAVYRKRYLRTVTNYILASLALSDFLSGLVSIPAYLACSAIQELNICTVSELFLRFTSVSTVAHLFCVTMDRYVSIMCSLRYCTLVTKKRAFITIALMWLVAMFTSLIQLSWFNTDEDVNEDASVEIQNHDLRYDIFSLVVFFAILLAVMVYVYLCILVEVRRQNRMIRRHSMPGWADKCKKNDKERKAVLTFAAMVACYVVGWLPYFTLRIQHNLNIVSLPHWAEYLLIYLRYATSLANPMLYILGKQDFRRALPPFGRARAETTQSMSRTENLRLTEAKSSAI